LGSLQAEHLIMSECSIARLPDRTVLRVSGPAAGAFLQGLVTNNVEKVTETRAVHAGLLTPQGKILFDFFIIADGESFLLDVDQDKAAALAQRLGFYKLRAAVEITPEPDFVVAACWGASPELPAGIIAYADPRLPQLGVRLLVSAGADLSALGCAAASESDYHARRIGLGVPEGGRDYSYGEAFPHEAMFDQLDGVDFKKGCFVGQEVVSRMEHRGTARKRIVRIEGEGPLPESGTEITAGPAAIGTLGSVSGASGLALLRLDRAKEAKARGDQLRAGDVAVTFAVPSWARFKTPAPAAP
jgi:folate-binding protein YgfZ